MHVSSLIERSPHKSRLFFFCRMVHSTVPRLKKKKPEWPLIPAPTALVPKMFNTFSFHVDSDTIFWLMLFILNFTIISFGVRNSFCYLLNAPSQWHLPSVSLQLSFIERLNDTLLLNCPSPSKICAVGFLASRSSRSRICFYLPVDMIY